MQLALNMLDIAKETRMSKRTETSSDLKIFLPSVALHTKFDVL